MTEKDLNKRIKVFLKNGDTRSGILTAFDSREITITDPASNNQDTFPFEAVEKIELKTKTYAPLAVIGLVGILVILGIIVNGWGKAISQMGV